MAAPAACASAPAAAHGNAERSYVPSTRRIRTAAVLPARRVDSARPVATGARCAATIETVFVSLAAVLEEPLVSFADSGAAKRRCFEAVRISAVVFDLAG